MKNLTESKKKTKTLVIILSIIAAILVIIGNAMNQIISVIGLFVEIIAIFFLLHYLKYLGNEKKLIIAYHFALTVIIFFICSLLVNTNKTLSSTILGTVALISLCGLFAYLVCDKVVISVIVGLLYVIPVIAKAPVIFNILLLVESLGALIYCLIKKKEDNKFFIVTEIFGMVLAAVNLLFFKEIPMYYELATICLSFIICSILTAFNLKDKVVTRSKVAKEEKTEKEEEPKKEKEPRSWVDKAYRNKSYKELLDCPVDALLGVSETDAQLLKSAFGIKTIGDFADNKYFTWAREIVEEANKK